MEESHSRRSYLLGFAMGFVALLAPGLLNVVDRISPCGTICATFWIVLIGELIVLAFIAGWLLADTGAPGRVAIVASSIVVLPFASSTAALVYVDSSPDIRWVTPLAFIFLLIVGYPTCLAAVSAALALRRSQRR